MELLGVTFVFTATILSVPTEAYYNLAMCVALSICVPPLEPLDYTAVLTLPPAPETNAGQKTAATTAHLLHKRDVASVPVDPVTRPYYGKRSAQVYQGLLQEKDHIFGKRSAAVYLEFDESNTDNFLAKILGKREAPRYPYKRSAAESLEVDESNADYDLGKEEAPAYPYKIAGPTAYRQHVGKRPEDVEQEKHSFVLGKRAAPTSMEAE